MQIRDLFLKPIDRPINGVIKADQRDAASIWQELDEYVLTTQLVGYFRKFFDAYLAAADNPNDPVLAARMGVWVSGFFGSGKSHFIKILSYLLENLEAHDPVTGATRRAASFFDASKIKDAMLLADVQRATRGSADVMLFNIDAKATGKSERDVILQVFLRVFNERLGYSEEPHIAQLERHLVAQGAYDTFQTEFLARKGSAWRAERDSVDFLRDDVVASLAVALGMREESAAAWFDNARDSYKISIEGLATLIRDDLETRPAGHRVVFLVDEIGQFIGANTQLMLTLQTITEQLGTLCKGRAWVIVTSQEDIDAALGDANKARSQDFSKIQGRFHTRLSLASSNTDEVIGERLLAKTEDAHRALRSVFERQGDIINHQLSFVGATTGLRGYRDAAEFVAVYPYAPYQFVLLQKVFESIRRVGATGKHLSRGERSLLDAFQSATRRNASRGLDALVPLQDFYPSIESFLDTSVKRAIDQAGDNRALQLPGDLDLLKALFLIRYVAEVLKPTLDNLATLSLDRIDADKLALKRRLQASLERLEAEKLVSRNGDQWFFLTNEERDVAREIGHVEVSAAEKARLLGEMVFDEVLAGQTRVRHRDTKGDYDFNRLLDGAPYKAAHHVLSVEVLTPLGDDYERLSESYCLLRSGEGEGRALIRLDEGQRLDVELTLYLQIEKYVEGPKAGTATPSLRKIMAERKDENRERRTRLVGLLAGLMTGGTFYAKGQSLTSRAASPGTLLDELVNYLITNTFHKLQLLKVRQNDPVAEIRAVLAADDVTQRGLALGGEAGNPQALADVREYLTLKARDTRVLLADVVDRYSGVPYGWKPDWETVLIVARLFMAGEVKLMLEGADLTPAAAVEVLTKPARFKQVSLLKRKQADAGSVKRARELYKELFAELAREESDALVADWRGQLDGWATRLRQCKPLAAQKHHPGLKTLDALLAQVQAQQAIRDAYEFIEALHRSRDDWRDAGEDMADLGAFYEQQLPTWRRLLEALATFEDNREALAKETKAGEALKAMEALRDDAAPYSKIARIEPLVATVQTVNDALAGAQREAALGSIEARIAEVQEALNQIGAAPALCNRALQPLQTLKVKVVGMTSLPQIAYLQGQAGDRLDEAMAVIRLSVAPPPPPPPPVPGKPPVVVPPPPAAPKESKTVQASALLKRSYLESEAEIDEYLGRLRGKLVDVVKAGQRVRVQ